MALAGRWCFCCWYLAVMCDIKIGRRCQNVISGQNGLMKWIWVPSWVHYSMNARTNINVRYWTIRHSIYLP
jgi:putative SOS response-associated peptidase YedK